MITIQETTRDDLLNVQALWADGDVMKFVGFPEGLHETLENLERCQTAAGKPLLRL